MEDRMSPTKSIKLQNAIIFQNKNKKNFHSEK